MPTTRVFASAFPRLDRRVFVSHTTKSSGLDEQADMSGCRLKDFLKVFLKRISLRPGQARSDVVGGGPPGVIFYATPTSKTPVWQNHRLYLDFPVSKVEKVIFDKCQSLVYFDRGLGLFTARSSFLTKSKSV